MKSIAILVAALLAAQFLSFPTKLQAQCAVCGSAEGIPDHCKYGPYANSHSSCRWTPLFGCDLGGCCEGSGCEPEAPEGLTLAGSVIVEGIPVMYAETSQRTCSGVLAVVGTSNIELAEGAPGVLVL